MRNLRFSVVVSSTLLASISSFPFAVEVQSAPGQTQTVQQSVAKSPEEKEADSLNAEVVKLYALGDYNKALPIARKVVDLRKKTVGENHPLYASALFNLANTQLAKFQYDDSYKSFAKTLAIQESIFGTEDIKLCRTLDALGYIAYASGRASEAKTIFSREIGIREKTRGANVQELLRPLNLLAQVHQNQKEYEEAAKLYARRAEIGEKLLAENKKAEAKDRDLVKEYWEDCECAWRQAENYDEVRRADTQARKVAGELPINDDSLDGLQVNEGVLRGKATRQKATEYPLAARAARVSGDVIAFLAVDETGRVLEAKAKCGHPLLREASEAAAKQWKFNPTLADGRPVKVTGIVTFRFLPPPGSK